MKFLNFGSLNIDHVYAVDHFVRAGETLSAHDLQMFCGGKGLNQSIALSRCGIEVYHGGAVGADGEMLLELLRENGVHTEHVFVKDCPSGHAIIQNDRTGQNCIMLYGGANQALTRADVDQVLESFVSGDVILLQNEINQMSYIMERAHEKGMTIILNPSPADEKLLTYPIQYVDYLILNEIEIRELCQGLSGGAYPGAAAVRSDAQEAVEPERMAQEVMELEGMAQEESALAARLLTLFPDMKIILTLGSRGSVYMDRQQAIAQKAYAVKAVDTTAAGDTFTGYLFGCLFAQGAKNGPEQLVLGAVLDMAAKAAAMAVTKKGAAPSIPWKKEVEAFEIIS